MTKALISVVETFGPTIQGEGSLVGTPTWFIRTGGCDFTCEQCDSIHAVDPIFVNKSPRMSGTALGEKILADMGGIQWVTISGGNPCIWEELGDTIEILQTGNKKIALETQGTIAASWLNKCDVITVSPKAPGMGADFRLDVLQTFLAHIPPHIKVILKVVVFPPYKEDIDFAVVLHRALSEYDFYISQGNSWVNGEAKIDRLQYDFPKLLEHVYNNAALSDVSVLPQLHVWLWGNKRGV